MEKYPKPGNGSAITGYQIETDRIFVRYQNGQVYGYSYDSAGQYHVEEMKRLARAGEGLHRYIRDHVYHDFFDHGTEAAMLPQKSAKTLRYAGVARMPEALREFDFREYHCGCDRNYRSVEVFYSSTVAEEDKVPGLIEFVRSEYTMIMSFMMDFFHTDNLPWEIYIELSDRRVVNEYGTMSDTEIVNEIQNRYAEELCPDPEKIREILAQRISKHPVNGTYHMEPCHIKLYYRTFDTTHGQDGYLAEVRQTLAHELLHAKHHIDARGIFADKSWPAVRVKEALADFFAVHYVLDPNTCCWGDAVACESRRVAEKRFDAWERRLGGTWPYAYAIRFLPEPHALMDVFYGGWWREKYMDVWEISCVDMQKADDRLMS